VGGRVAERAVGRGAGGAQHAVERRAEAQDGLAALGVARVGHEAHAVDAPDVEGVGQHEALGLDVDSGPLGRRLEPGPADLDGIGSIVRVVQRMAGRPGPALEVAEARRADDASRGAVDRREGHGLAGGALGEGRLDVVPHPGLVGGDVGQRERLAPAARDPEQRRKVGRVEGLEAHEAALEVQRLEWRRVTRLVRAGHELVAAEVRVARAPGSLFSPGGRGPRTSSHQRFSAAAMSPTF
jgi:hypothetical protein